MRIVGVTKCPAGLAHTYIAAELLEQTAQEFGYEITVETQGATGRENSLTEEVIKEADIVVLAIDVEIEERERFDGKRVIEISIMDFLGAPEELFTSLTDKGQIQNEVAQDEEMIEEESSQALKHFLTGITFISPFLVAIGGALAISAMFPSLSMDVKHWSQIAYQFVFILFCGKVSESLNGHYAIAPVALSALYLSQNSFGFGAILIGVLITYLYGWLWKKIQVIKLSKELSPILPLYFYPLIGTIICVGLAYLLAPVGTYLSVYYETALYFIFEHPIARFIFTIAIACSLVLGIGTPVNKLVYSFALLSLMTGHFEVMAIVAITIGMPALSLWVASFVHRERLSIDVKMQRKLFFGSLFGLTEPLFDVIKRTEKKLLGVVMMGTLCAALIVSHFVVEVTIPNGGVLTVLFGVFSGHGYYLLAMLLGSIVVNVLLFGVKKEG